MKTLNLYSAEGFSELDWPTHKKDLNIRSPSLYFFTDFSQTRPIVIDPSVPVIEVKQLMQKLHVRLQLIVNENKQFVGVISDDDLSDNEIMKNTPKDAIRNEILAEELMTPRKSLMALDYEDVCSSSIARVITALKNNGQRHSLVIDRKTDKIRGIFSASDISRKLHLDIDIQDSPSFTKVFLKVA